MALDPSKYAEIAQRICEILDEYDTETAMTVLVHVTGQVVAHLAEGVPSRIKERGKHLSEAILSAAVAKIIHDDNVRRMQ